jgi:hypothetical protein
MPPRKKKTRRRRDTSIRLLNVLEAYTYASIMSEGILGTSPWGFVTGEFDLIEQKVTRPMTGEEISWAGTDEISLRDLAKEPGVALAQMTTNFSASITNMAIQGVLTGLTFKVGRRLLRRQVNMVNRSIFAPLGMGVKL